MQQNAQPGHQHPGAIDAAYLPQQHAGPGPGSTFHPPPHQQQAGNLAPLPQDVPQHQYGTQLSHHHPPVQQPPHAPLQQGIELPPEAPMEAGGTLGTLPYTGMDAHPNHQNYMQPPSMPQAQQHSDEVQSLQQQLQQQQVRQQQLQHQIEQQQRMLAEARRLPGGLAPGGGHAFGSTAMETQQEQQQHPLSHDSTVLRHAQLQYGLTGPATQQYLCTTANSPPDPRPYPHLGHSHSRHSSMLLPSLHPSLYPGYQHQQALLVAASPSQHGPLGLEYSQLLHSSYMSDPLQQRLALEAAWAERQHLPPAAAKAASKRKGLADLGLGKATKRPGALRACILSIKPWSQMCILPN